jgi:hypothetical protein
MGHLQDLLVVADGLLWRLILRSSSAKVYNVEAVRLMSIALSKHLLAKFSPFFS